MSQVSPYAAVYGIAIPETEKEKCIHLMENNPALKQLKIRLFLAYRKNNGDLFAYEMKPAQIYKTKK